MPRKQRSQKKQEAEVEPAVTIRGAKRLYNILVERGQVKLTIEQGIQMLEGMYKQMGRKKRVYACAACGIKIASSCALSAHTVQTFGTVGVNVRP